MRSTADRDDVANVIGGMTLEQTLTSPRDDHDQLRGILDEATGKWGFVSTVSS